MHIKGKYSWAKHLDFMIVDLAALIIAFFVAYYLKFSTFSISTDWQRFVVIISLLNIVIDLFVNPYSGIFHRRYYFEIGRTIATVLTNAILAVIILYVLKIGANYSREVFFDTYIFYFILTVFMKYAWKKLLSTGKIPLYSTKKMSLFIVSTEENAEKDIHSIYSTDLPLYEIKGVHLVSDESTKLITRSSILYKTEKETIEVPVIQENEIPFILDNNIDEVLIAVAHDNVPVSAVKELIANGVGVNYVVEPLLGIQTEEQFITNIGVNKALSIGTFSFSPSQNTYLMVKRLFDVICGLIGAIVLIPVTVGVKIAYLASGDNAKIFYRQKRVGQNGKIIRIWKFRSMVPNAGEILEQMLKEENYRKEWEENQKFENDPRITKVGSFLRKTSIDELPQLLNVLVGDMSLVGPRPLVEGELIAHNGLKLYEKVKPGITGWWGCNGRSNIDYRERLELEYYYVKNCSLYLDVLCIIRTVFAVLRKDGAQ